MTSKEDIERYGIAEFNARCREIGAQPRRGLEPADRADRPLDRSGGRLPDARSRLHRVGLVGAEDDLRQGAAVREAEGRPVLPAMRDRALEPRARAARRLPGRPGPVRVRPLPGDRGPRAGPPRRRAADLDDDTVDARLQRRGGGRPGAHVRESRRRRPHRDPRRGAGRPRDSGQRTIEARFKGAELVGAPLRPAVSISSPAASTAPRATRCSPPTSSPPRMAPGSCTRRSRSARTTSASASSRASNRSTRSSPTAPTTSRIGPYADRWVKDADQDLIEDLRASGKLLRAETYEHSYPHCWRCGTPLLYYAKPSWYIATSQIKDRLLASERDRQLVPRARQARPLRQLARGQRRLGAEPRALLGHAASDLALPPRTLRGDRVDRGARTSSPARTSPTPTGRSSTMRPSTAPPAASR